MTEKTAPATTVFVLGIRHHGPGSARAVLSALELYQPEVVVIEGPADAQEVMSLASHVELVPPVAIAVYPQDDARSVVYFPLAEFSPEWQAMRWSASNQRPCHFMDLPQSIQIAMHREQVLREFREGEVAAESPIVEEKIEPKEPSGEPGFGSENAETEKREEAVPVWRADPLAVLAEAAGYHDHELWWEELIERRRDATGAFEAIAEAMTAVRAEFPEQGERDLLREAYMRQTLRSVMKSGAQRIAVVCGAWHVPALSREAIDGHKSGMDAKSDAALLKGRPTVKTVATWIPWTHSRLTYASGYGAGVESPGWYAHIWRSSDDAPMRWLASAAMQLRKKDLDASSASVIEAVRLADALAAMRDRRSPGLMELNEAILAVLCNGQPAPMQFIRQKLEVGDVMGEVPADAPAVPLARDLVATSKQLNLKQSAENKAIELDLRTPLGLGRSQFLHRLQILGVSWGEMSSTAKSLGTFKEIWRLEWKPELALAVIEASLWGATVESAAVAKVVSDGETAAELAMATHWLEIAVVAGLVAAVDPLVAVVAARSTGAADVRRMMEALPALARLSRYGDVRGTRPEQVLPIAVGLFERAMVGLPNAASGLDTTAAEEMLRAMEMAQEAIEVLANNEIQTTWRSRLRLMMEGGFHGVIAGWCCRRLFEAQCLEGGELEGVAHRALSVGNEPADAAAWLAGLLKGSGARLLHQDELWRILDRWLQSISEESFPTLLPLLRRSFSDFTGYERRQMGEKMKRLTMTKAAALTVETSDIDWDRARVVFPTLALFIGSNKPPK